MLEAVKLLWKPPLQIFARKLSGGSSRQLFADESDLVGHIERFADVLEAAAALDGQFSDAAAKERIVCGRLSPAFQAWKLAVEGGLRRYVVQ
ncbi:hypothetical protein UM396_16095 [Geobacillus subterraneus]|uniref:hypothetical protein n=1 Tax=Geobacillus subterraneus TaxID=129338 RepID=UPI002AC8A8C4|nr:hypothetical protein [Geobacillus subterraneus]WPZ18063.1 hypothetical protein UM396_16095 [Geobacillus subterraneus]